MHVDNATQNAMQCKCIALRRIAVRKLPLLPPYGRRSKGLKTVVVESLFLLFLISKLKQTNPGLGFGWGFIRVEPAVFTWSWLYRQNLGKG